MKKRTRWSALALGLLVAGEARSDLALYGVADLGLRRAGGLDARDAPARGNTFSLHGGVHTTSRWGMRAQEALGGGLSALFQLESGLNLDTGGNANATKLFDRAAWLGLRGAWGTLSAGRQTSMLADTIGVVDPLERHFARYNPNIQYAGLSQHGLGADFGGSGSNSSAYRQDNALKYHARAGDTTLRALYAFGETAGRASARQSFGLGLAQAAGPATLAGGWQTFRDARGRHLDAYVLGAVYQRQGLRVSGSAAHNALRDEAGRAAQQRVYGAGVRYAAHAQVDLSVAWYRLERRRRALPADGFERVFALAEYRLSRRSRLYAEADYTLFRGAFQGSGTRPRASGITLGLTHHF